MVALFYYFVPSRGNDVAFVSRLGEMTKNNAVLKAKGMN